MSDSVTMDCSPPGSSVHGILQARILEWVAMPSSRGSSWPRDWTCIPSSPALTGGLFASKAQKYQSCLSKIPKLELPIWWTWNREGSHPSMLTCKFGGRGWESHITYLSEGEDKSQCLRKSFNVMEPRFAPNSRANTLIPYLQLTQDKIFLLNLLGYLISSLPFTDLFLFLQTETSFCVFSFWWI